MATLVQGRARSGPTFAERFAHVPYHWQALVVIVLGSFMVVLDTTIVNVALPRIIQVFQSDVNEGQLVLTGYMLALAVVMPATGYLSDTFGAKRIYMLTIVLFTAGSLLCGLAPNIEGLIVFRVIQGLGGGMLMPLGMSILFQVAPANQRGTIMGVFGLPLLIAPVIGPTLGGYLVEYVDWRPIFTLNVPIGVAALLAGMVILRETPTREGTRFDIWGFVLSSIAFSAAMLALERAPDDGWYDPYVVTLLLVSAAAFPCWIVVELAQEQPLLDLSVLKDRTFFVATMVSFVATIAMYSSLLLLPLFLQNVRGLGAMETGLLLLPQALAAAVMMPISGRLLDAFGPKLVVIPGLALLGFATWLLVNLDVGTPDSTIRWILLMRGAAMGLMMMPVTTVSMDTIPPHQISRASALSNVLRQLFGAFSTGIFATILLSREQFHQALLVQNVTSTNVAAVGLLSATQSAMMQQGMSAVAAQSIGVAALMKQVGTLATVQSFNDCFYLATLVSLCGLVPCLWLKRGKKAAGGHGEAMILE
jgi:EmrB/QacA subfamily drug resistance transporter